VSTAVGSSFYNGVVAERPIAVLYDGNAVGRKGRMLPGPFSRATAYLDMKAAGATCDITGCVLCRPGREAECKAVGVWQRAVRSTFCHEPNGDTPLRSHLYLAAVTGCIPVVFDNASLGHWPVEPTWYAWRAPPDKLAAANQLVVGDASWGVWPAAGAPSGPLLDYAQFSVAFTWRSAEKCWVLPPPRTSPALHCFAPSWFANSSAAEPAAGPPDWPSALRAWPAAQVLALSQGLNNSSRLLRYSDDECGEDCDAFSRFRAIVTAAWLLLEHPTADFTPGKVARVAPSGGVLAS